MQSALYAQISIHLRGIPSYLEGGGRVKQQHSFAIGPAEQGISLNRLASAKLSL
jgi:hypothetical protein